MMIRNLSVKIFCLGFILLASAACHKDHAYQSEIGLLETDTATIFNTASTLTPVQTLDADFLSQFPRRVGSTNLQQVGGVDMAGTAITAPQVIFTMPLAMEATCIGGDCGPSINLEGHGLMIVDLDQRVVTLEQIDLTDQDMRYHLSGLMTYRFDEFNHFKNADAQSMLSFSTEDQVISTDPAATMIISDGNLDTGTATVDLQASGQDYIFLGHGVTSGNELK